MAETRFAVVANCQARPISQIVRRLSPDWTHVGDVVVHLAGPGQRDKHMSLLQQADIIFAQLVGDGYKAGHLATSVLKDAFGDRVISWPNLFFHGQTTDIFNLTTRLGRVTGPLGNYHSLIVYDHWREGLPVADAITAMRDPDFGDADEIRSRATRSLAGLEKREQLADVPIADFIATRWRDQPLFHVFNHPATVTLIEMATRLTAAAGCSSTTSPIEPDDIGEPLGKLRPFAPASHVRAIELTYPQISEARGRKLEFTDDEVNSGRPRKWTLDDFVETSFRCFDAQSEAARAARLTPPLAKPSNPGGT